MTYKNGVFVFKPDDRPSVASPVAALSWRLQNQTNESDYRLRNEIQNIMRTTEAPKQFIKIAKADRPRD